MSDAANPAASRAGQAAGTSSYRAGRIDGRAWRDVERALRLGRKHDVHSVECHGVRFVFRFAHHSSQDNQEKEHMGASAGNRRNEPSRGSRMASSPPQPNSAQRRSAARMARYILAKKGSGSSMSQDPAAPAGTSAPAPALVETDERVGAPMEIAERAAPGRLGSPAAVSSAARHTTITQPQQPGCARQGAKRPAESARRGPGLMPLNPTPEEDRRSGAELALESRRGGRTLEG